MKLLIKQRVFAWGSKFDIYDENCRAVYFCKSQIISIGKKLWVYDQNNREVIYIEQQLFRIMPHYDIYIGGKKVATLIKNFTLFTHDYRYKGIDWNISGQILAHNYQIESGREVVAQIDKRWIAWGDTYEVNLNEKFDTMLALASVIVIDCVCHRDN